jgi:signal transduction histidine kinase
MDEGVNFKRRVMENLRPTLLDNMGLFPALNWLLEETCARGNLNFQRVFPVSEPALSDEVRIAIFRVLQEAFTNVLAHAGATNIELRIATEVTQLLITIRDDGRGMDTSAKHVGAHGLINMRHRLGDIGGELEILSTPGHGTVLTARIPIGLQSGTAEPTGGS